MNVISHCKDLTINRTDELMEQYNGDGIDSNYNDEPKNLVHHQDMEFSILGIKVKWRGTVFFSVLALSVMLNFYLVFKVMSIQGEVSRMQQTMYEKLIEEIRPRVESINDNVEKANKKLDEKLKQNNSIDHEVEE